MIGKSPRLKLTGFASLVILAGCAAPKTTPVALRFVPPAAQITETPRLPAPPNLYLANEGPSPTIERYRQTTVPTPSDLLVSRADDALQRGRRYYQSGDTDNARRQFDRAVDLLFQASDHPTDRAAFERKFDETVDAISRYDLAGLGPSSAQEVPGFEKSPLEDILELTFPVDPKLKSKVREEVAATVSQLPLTVNDSVLGFIQFFSGRGRNTMIAGMKRAGRYRPLIQRILDEEGLPPELIYLAQAESGFHPRAVSRVRATGMWQFMQFRGREYGLMQTAYSDDRLDPERATRAAAKHLRDLYHQFGDWYLAIAAYNCGPGNVQKAVERTGYADFWQLRSRRTLPLETTNYVPIILAMTIMQKNAARYDLEEVLPDSPLMYDVITTTSPTHLALIADLTETPVAEVQELNPSLLRSIAPEGYRLRVPHGSAANLLAALDLVPPERRASWRMHRVESGETLADIGRMYGASPNVIAAANKIEADDPETGDLLMIPQAAVRPAVLKTPVRATAKKTSSKRKSAPASRVSGRRSRSVGRT